MTPPRTPGHSSAVSQCGVGNDDLRDSRRRELRWQLVVAVAHKASQHLLQLNYPTGAFGHINVSSTDKAVSETEESHAGAAAPHHPTRNQPCYRPSTASKQLRRVRLFLDSRATGRTQTGALASVPQSGSHVARADRQKPTVQTGGQLQWERQRRSNTEEERRLLCSALHRSF